jgi:hypothetical protein
MTIMGSVRFLHFDFDDSRSAPISTLIDDLLMCEMNIVGPLSTIAEGVFFGYRWNCNELMVYGNGFLMIAAELQESKHYYQCNICISIVVWTHMICA